MLAAQSDHVSILDALVKRQATRVEALMREHIYKGRENLRGELERMRLQSAAPRRNTPA